MKFVCLFIVVLFIWPCAFAQESVIDTLPPSKPSHNIIHSDERIDRLGKKMLEYNENLALKIQLVDGYRLQLLNTSDREAAMKIRTALIQQYPDQKLYMTFQSPYLKLKLGNFLQKEEAEKFKKILIDSKLIPNNIYVVPEKVEQKPTDKNAATEEQ